MALFAVGALAWGVRLNRIEILDITPPNNVLQAMSEQKEAEQHKRAAILKSEGDQQSAVNSAQGGKQAAILAAEGGKQAAILAAEAQQKVLELWAEGEKRARRLRGEGEASALAAIDKVAINPNTLAVLQLRALQDLASSPNSKVVVPYAAVGLVGNAEMLVQALQGTTLPTPAPAAPASAAVQRHAWTRNAQRLRPPCTGLTAALSGSGRDTEALGIT